MPQVILSIDQGTTGTTVVLLDRKLNVLAKGYQEIKQIYPQPGWVEHDLENIWRSVLNAIETALKKSDISSSDIKAIGISNQRETVAVWSRETCVPYHRAIVWQCRRTAGICEQLKKAGYEEQFIKKTGLLLDPYFSGTKLKWLFDNLPGLWDEADAGRVAAGTIDTFLIWKLSGGRSHATDISNASRTLLMDLNTLSWDEELAAVLDVPMNILPEIRDSAGIFGTTRDVAILPDGIPICGVAGDQQAALFGQACFEAGEAKCTYGTGAFLLMNTGPAPLPSKNNLLTTVAWKLGEKTTYALEGSAFIAGAAVQWLRDELKFINSAEEIETLASQVSDTGGVTLVPAFAGLGAPHWRNEARGIISGLTLSTTRAHLARAMLEGIALQNVEILEAMESDSGRKLLRLKVDGGAAANNLLMQMQADFLGRTIIRPAMLETTAVGAAFLAGLGAGIYRDTDDIIRAWKKERTFTPKIDEDERTAVLERWRNAVNKA